VYKLRWADVDFEGRLIRLGTRKRKNGSLEFEQIPMLDELGEALQEYREESEGLWVFSQPTGRRKGQPYTENRGFPQDLCRQAGVKPFGCHAIRHLSASILAQNNVPMIAIQQILRHKKLSTTERYVRGLEPVRVHLQVLSGGFLKNKPTTEPTKEKGLKAV
jgi:integrase